MDPFGLEEVDGVRTRSFRDEGYNNRRVFLRSYPLHWGPEDGDDDGDHDREKEENKFEKREVGGKSRSGDNIKKPMKKIIPSIFHWGEERAIVLKRFKNKITIYVIACYPVGFKARTPFISS